MLSDDLRAKADEIDRAVSRNKDERDDGTFGEIELMRAAANALCIAEAMVWRDIETAPKDGTLIILYDADLGKNYRTQTAFWNDQINNWQTSEDGSPDINPTRWMPMPAFPT